MAARNSAESSVQARSPRMSAQAGFSLVELLIAVTILMIVSGVVMSGLSQLITSQATIWNRTEMHSGVRSTTELLQQEVGQAGRVTFPPPWPDTPVTVANSALHGGTTLTVSSSAGMFVGELLTVGAGTNRETIKIGALAGNTITLDGTFNPPTITAPAGHIVGSPVNVYGGFSSGIVPCASSAACPGSSVTTTFTNGSTGSVLKLYGDINGDGNMVYIEYTCDTAAASLYRNMMAWNAAAKPAVTPAQLLLGNIQANPGGTPCFTYQQETLGGVTFVTDVAITLTVRTQVQDPTTKQFQTETKALLNVSPRNVFNVWELASQGSWNRVQPMPLNIANNLLP